MTKRFPLLPFLKETSRALCHYELNAGIVELLSSGLPFLQALFQLDGRSWISVEAYFHAEKYRPYSQELYERFSMDSNSVLSTSSGEKLKSAGRKFDFSNSRSRVDADCY